MGLKLFEIEFVVVVWVLIVLVSCYFDLEWVIVGVCMLCC